MAITNPLKVIRAKCLECCCGLTEEVKVCPLWPFRFGKNPNRKPKTEAQMAAAHAAGQRMKESKR